MSKDNYICYILKCGNYTYNGCTNNFKRRIRQHNGEIKGGAKCTSRRGPWEPYCIITGFKDNIEALQAEWRIKKVEGIRIVDSKGRNKVSYRRRPARFSRPKGRIKGLNQILKLEQFTSKSQRLIKDMELTIYLDKEYHELLEELPDNILLKDINEFFI
jgi:structure-specific endonuclease subunit SLX1